MDKIISGLGERPSPRIVFHKVDLGGRAAEIAVDADAGDPLSHQVSQGLLPSKPLVDLMLQMVRPGVRVLDLGAHIGTFSLAAAAAGCHVMSVEASPRNAELLRASAARNGFGLMHVAEVAVGDTRGFAEFAADGPFGHVLAPGWGKANCSVRMAPVEDLLIELGWEGVDFIKMDVEGSELRALAGMTELLRGRTAPPILYESNSHTLRATGNTPSELKRRFEELGYRNYLVDHGQLSPLSASDFQPGTVVDHLAVKQLPIGISGWQVREPLTKNELIERTLLECKSPYADCRAAIAHSLRSAPSWLLHRRPVLDALVNLANDPEPRVAKAAAWSQAFGFRWRSNVLKAIDLVRHRRRRAA